MISRQQMIFRADSLPNGLKGALWMTLAGIVLAIAAVATRIVTLEIHPLMVAFFRYLFSVVLLVPWFMKTDISVFKSARPGLHLARAAFAFLGVSGGIYAITMIPLGDAVALSYLAPVFAALGATLILGEKVYIPRIIAMAGGFVGCIIVIRPGFADINWGVFAGIMYAVGLAGGILCVRVLSRFDSPTKIVALGNLIGLPFAFVIALFVWEWPGLEVIAWLLIVALASTLGQICFVRALSKAEASLVLPFDYTRLAFSALFGIVLFAEPFDLWTWLGAAVTLASVAYIAYREARVARAGQTTAKTPAEAP